jgi:hypothetical protein
MAGQPVDQIEKRAQRLKHYSWFFLALLLLMVLGYGTDLVSGKRSFFWHEAVAITLPFLTLALAMAAARDTLLVFLCMKNMKDSQRDRTSPFGEALPHH